MQSSSESAPWVNAEYMKRYVNSAVRLVGAVQDQPVRGILTLRSSDNQPVQVQIKADSVYGHSEVVEVRGVVQSSHPGQPQMLAEISHVNYEQAHGCKPFNLENYNRLVEYSNMPQYQRLWGRL